MVDPQLLSDIHAQFRRQMNADVGAALRRHGVAYRVAFGVPSMRLAEVAALYEPSVELAEALWGEDIRESRMLATRLYPVAAMTADVARRWVDQCPTDEVADQLAMHLLSRMSGAGELALSLADAPGRTARYVAMKLAARLAPDDLAAGACATLAAAAATTMDDPANDMALRTAAMWAHDNLTQHT